MLCEQVVGRGLRHQSYDLDEHGMFSVEYADILGIPFDFTAKPVVAPPKPPRPTVRVCATRPERDAHTALGDVQTVADLMAQVLRPIAGHRGLDTWEKLVAFAAEEWFPSRIAFGKHKGRLIREARKDAELRGWLDWLAKDSNARNAKIGRWY